ncbi:hypothetical protein Tco_0688756 [Tanacetum coccineum]
MKDLQHSFRNSDEYYHDPEKCEHAGPKEGSFARDCFSKTSVPSYQSPFQPKLLYSSEHKPELRHTKDFKAKNNKVKAKLALLSSSASSPKSSSGKNKGLIAETYECDEEEVSSDENEEIEVKALMALANEERVFVSKESASNETWLNSSNKFNQCISEQIPTKKNKILGIDQLTEDTSSSGPKDPVFEAEDSTLFNHDTGKHPLPPLEKLAGVKPVPGPKTIKSNLKSSPTFKAETLKGITLKEPSSVLTKDNKQGSLVSKTSSAPAGKLKIVKVDDDPPLAIVMKELNELKLQLSKKSHLILETISLNRTCDHAEFMSSLKTSQHHTGQGESSLRYKTSRPVISFPSYIPCGYNDHQSDDYVYYPRCELCGSYDHDTQNHNRIISLRRVIKPGNPQHVTKHCNTCGSNAHTTTDHNNIEWFRKGKAKKLELIK